MKIFSKMLLIALSILLFVATAEFLTRRYTSYYLNKDKNNVESLSRLYVEDVHIGIVYKLRPNLNTRYLNKPFTTNQYGMRNSPETIEKESFKILGIGDSVMMGWGVADSETYLSLLSKKLNDRTQGNHRKVQVFNAAVFGYNTTQIYYTLSRYINLIKPDLVVWGYVGNDYQTIAQKRGMLPYNSPLYFVNYIQFAWFHLTNRFQKDHVYTWIPIVKPTVFHDRFEFSLNRIVTMTKLMRKIPLIVVMDSRYVNENMFHSKLEKILRAKGVTAINLFRRFRSIKEEDGVQYAMTVDDEHNRIYILSKKDKHPNRRWHARVSQILSEYIAKNIRL